MDKKLKKYEDKRTDRIIRDRGDLKKGVLSKDLDIKDFLPVRECGDSKVSPRLLRTPHVKTNEKPVSKTKVTSVKNSEKPISITKLTSLQSSDKPLSNTEVASNKNSEKAISNIKVCRLERKKTTSSTEKNELNKSITVDNEYRDDLTRNERYAKPIPKVVFKKKLAESKAKSTLLPPVKESKSVTEQNDNRGNLEPPVKIPKLNLDKGKLDDGSKAKNRQPARDNRIFDKGEAPTKTYLDLEGRKRLRERYTVKLKNSQISNKNVDVRGNAKNGDGDSKQIEGKVLDKTKSNESTNESAKQVKKTKETNMQRKPIIKTIRLNNDNRVYKAVTFIDQKDITPLQIKMPSHDKKDKKSVETNTIRNKVKTVVSKVSIQIKPMIKAKDKSRLHKKRVASPVIVTRNCSPTTEVAKWAPSCLNRHTKPYYEAWVDTTLAAITKCSEKDKLYVDKQNIIKTFKRALELDMRTSEDLVYEKFKDERYTGRITVRQGNIK